MISKRFEVRLDAETGEEYVLDTETGIIMSIDDLCEMANLLYGL